MKTDTNNTAGSDYQERLVRLLARFRGFVSARRETAERWRDKGEPRVASSSDRAADFFERCADELERVTNGEMPADPGCDWPPANALTAERNTELLADYVRDKQALAKALGTDPIHDHMLREVGALKEEAENWRAEHARR